MSEKKESRRWCQTCKKIKNLFDIHYEGKMPHCIVCGTLLKGIRNNDSVEMSEKKNELKACRCGRSGHVISFSRQDRDFYISCKCGLMIQHIKKEELIKAWNNRTPQELEPKVTGQTSDGYHTFDELYDHRIALFCTLLKFVDGWKSKLHEDGS